MASVLDCGFSDSSLVFADACCEPCGVFGGQFGNELDDVVDGSECSWDSEDELESEWGGDGFFVVEYFGFLVVAQLVCFAHDVDVVFA